MGATTGKLEFGWRKIFPRSNNLCANKKMAEGDRGEPLVFMGLPIAGTVGALSQPLAAAGVTVSTLPSATILLAWLYLLNLPLYLHCLEFKALTILFCLQ